jgi:hypothetical protein
MIDRTYGRLARDSHGSILGSLRSSAESFWCFPASSSDGDDGG